MAGFKVVKLALLNDLRYAQANQFTDPFLYQQFSVWLETIRKAKGWVDLKWRIENIPLQGMVAFIKYDITRWLKAIEQHCLVPDIVPDPDTPEGHLFYLRKEFEKVRVRYNKAQPDSDLRDELRDELKELTDDIFDLEFPV